MRFAPLVLALLLALGTWSGQARAESTTPSIVLLRDPGADPVVSEALSRLRSELQAAGFPVTEVAAGEASENAAASAASFTFFIRRGGGLNQVDIGLTDKLTAKTSTRHVVIPGQGSSSDASLLAIRASELLRASLLEASVEPKPTKTAPPATPRPVSPTLERFVGPVESRRRRPLLQGPHFLLGVSGLFSFEGLGASLAPTLRAGVGLAGPLSIRLSLTGPTLTPELSAAAGEATLRQELGLVELVYGFGGRDALFVPMLALGGGVYHVAVQGSARSPYEGHRLTSWSAVADAGVGGALRLGNHAALLLDAHAIVAQPAPVVRIDQQRAGALGRPALLACLGLVASL